MTSAPQADAATDSDLAGVAAPSVGVRRKRPPTWSVVAGVLILVVAAGISAATIDTISGTDLLGVVRLTAVDIAHLRWQFAVLVIVLAGLHYVATAVAARAAAGLALPMGETLLVQLAAAAANRLTPAGLGGAALTARYFTRRGLDVPAAVGAVTALAVLGTVADLLVLCGLVLVGSRLGLGGSAREVEALTRHITGLLGPARSPWLWVAIAVLAPLAVFAVYVMRRRTGRVIPWQHLWQPFSRLARDPRSLATLIIASGCTTLILGVAFVASTAMVPGPSPAVGLGALLIAYMLGSAAGSAVPIPAGLGSSEAAFVAVLISVQVPPSNAVEVVLIFRLLTFWAPAAVGVLATRYLYRRRAL